MDEQINALVREALANPDLEAALHNVLDKLPAALGPATKSYARAIARITEDQVQLDVLRHLVNVQDWQGAREVVHSTMAIGDLADEMEMLAAAARETATRSAEEIRLRQELLSAALRLAIQAGLAAL